MNYRGEKRAALYRVKINFCQWLNIMSCGKVFQVWQKQPFQQRVQPKLKRARKTI
jgi:hypothetical protein